jgi:hypothetical protein
MTCSCNYFECFVEMGAVEVTPAAPTVVITGPQGIPMGGSDVFTVSVSNPLDGPVTLSLSTYPGTGSATFADGTTSETISTAGTQTFTVNGVQASSTANNILIAAQYGGYTIASQWFSVVSVSISLNTGAISPDNTASRVYLAGVNARGPLGQVIYTDQLGTLCSIGTELDGKVTPSNYTGIITLKRNIISGAGYVNWSLNGYFNPTADNSDPTVEVTTPTAMGNVFDLDAPGINAPAGGVNSIRYNFVEYPVLAGTSSQVPGPNFSPGGGLRYYVRVSCDPNLIFDATYAGDNQAGTPATLITFNFQ